MTLVKDEYLKGANMSQIVNMKNKVYSENKICSTTPELKSPTYVIDTSTYKCILYRRILGLLLIKK
jgi:hypothetical protein